MKIPLRIMVMGTRGKSSLIAAIADYLRKNNYRVMSRQTGLIPAVTYQDKLYYLRRSKSTTGYDRPAETKVVIEHFEKQYKNIDALVVENNAISEYHMSKLSAYIRPQLTVITTISPDHVVDQGPDPETTAEIYLNSVSSHSKIIFWSNHKIEYDQMRLTAKKLKLKFPILYGPLSERDKTVLEAVAETKIAKLRPYAEIYGKTARPDTILLKSEMIAPLDKGKVLINLGSINDLLHTQIFIDEIQRKYHGPYYLLLNFREDREDRSWIFMNYILPKISGAFDGIIIRSDHPAFTENYIKKYVAAKFPLIVCLPTHSFKDFKDRIIPILPIKSKVIILANTANDFGFEVIQHFKLFQESYPVLKHVTIASLN